MFRVILSSPNVLISDAWVVDWEKESKNNIHVCRKTHGMNSNSKFDIIIVRHNRGQEHLLMLESGRVLPHRGTRRRSFGTE